MGKKKGKKTQGGDEGSSSGAQQGQGQPPRQQQAPQQQAQQPPRQQAQQPPRQQPQQPPRQQQPPQQPPRQEQQRPAQQQQQQRQQQQGPRQPAGYPHQGQQQQKGRGQGRGSTPERDPRQQQQRPPPGPTGPQALPQQAGPWGAQKPGPQQQPPPGLAGPWGAQKSGPPQQPPSGPTGPQALPQQAGPWRGQRQGPQQQAGPWGGQRQSPPQQQVGPRSPPVAQQLPSPQIPQQVQSVGPQSPTRPQIEHGGSGEPHEQSAPQTAPTGKKGKGQQKGKKAADQGGQGEPHQSPPPSKELVPSMSLLRIKGFEAKGDISDKILIKPGTSGRKIRVLSNHVELKFGKFDTAVHYDVAITPDTPKSALRAVMEKFRLEHYKNRYPAFDGRKNMYSSSMLPFGESISDEVKILLDDREKVYKVQINFAKYVDLTPMKDLLQTKKSPMEAIQCIDIVLRSAPATNCITVGRSFFIKPPTIINLGEGMEMYNGFFQSAIRGWKPLLNIDVAHKAFPKAMPVVDALIDLLTSRFREVRREDLMRQPLDAMQQRTFEKFIKTLKIEYQLPGQSATRRVYRVNGLDQPANVKRFKQDNGSEMLILDYFRSKGCNLKFGNMPTLWVGSKTREQRVLLPIELCFIQENQVVNRKMTENQTSTMIKYAATNAETRKQKIMNGLMNANYNNHPCVREFGFSVGNNFENLEARILPPPLLGYANKTIQPSRGVWRSDTVPFVQGAVINKWTIVSTDRNDRIQMEPLADMVLRQSKSIGMNIVQKAIQPFVRLGGRATIMDYKKYFEARRDFDIIFVVVPNSGPQYAQVKKAAEINVGCLTQCIKARTLDRINPQTVMNILLKVNSKMNGLNHTLKERPRILSRPCMIMGADVTHPGPDSVDVPSVAAVTASHDPQAFKYNICSRLQPPTCEIIEDLMNITVEQLDYFFSKTRVKPERIIFIRDGVSEGQFEQVLNTELRAIRAACKKMGDGSYQPSITFIVVQKRHHTRLFPVNMKDSEDKNGNVPAGTCVDNTITHPFMQDFYLVSHASIQGVAKPTKYCTLWDENNLTNDDVEELCYFLCHMFTRCNRSVSYPAPTYYAHLAAARAKVHTEDERIDLNNLRKLQEKLQILDVIRKGKPMFFV